ncbi:MAG: TRAP transporter substrate-binding protein [Alphaproteobacteria bacterium]|nr:TRAP transporter substrate-binding protein [Alphaproteobacteria bacterium]
MRRTLTALAALAAFVVAAPAPAQTTLRFANTLAASDTHNEAARRMAEILKEKSGGKLTMTVHPGGELGNDNAILEGVRLGSIDIGLTGNPFFTQFAPRLNVMDLPYLFRDAAHAHAVMDGPIGAELLKDLERNRMKGIAFWEIGFRHVTNSKLSIKAPDDLKGLKIRTTPNKAHLEAFKLWGANPVPMAFTELYLALQTGTVDAQENPINNIFANRMYEVQKHLTLTGHAYTASIAAMSLVKFNQLPADQQKLVLDAALEAGRFQRDLNAKQEGENLAKIKAAGLTVVEKVDAEAFRKVVYDPVAKQYTDVHGREIVDRILAVK